MTNKHITVADLIAHLSQYPSDTPVSIGAGTLPIFHTKLVDDRGEITALFLHSCKTCASDERGQIPIIMPQHPYDAGLDGGKSFVLPVVGPMASIPAKSNPFWHDAGNMGTPLVRDWMAMHTGYDHKDQPAAMTYLYLVNTRSGQRIRIDLSRPMPEVDATPLRKIETHF